MAINATNEGGNFELAPAGSFSARCYSMVHIGTIKEVFKGEEKMFNKVRISWELPTEQKEFKPGEGLKPISISKEFNLSMNEKSNLRKFLEGWRGKGFTEEESKSFDITKLLGKTCMLSIIHKTSGKGNKYADINSASSLPKGLVCPDQINPNFEFSFTPFDDKKFSSLPEFLKKKIVESVEYKKLFSPEHTESQETSLVPNSGDDLPF